MFKDENDMIEFDKIEKREMGVAPKFHWFKKLCKSEEVLLNDSMNKTINKGLTTWKNWIQKRKLNTK
jgi:hypothetical protein